MSLQRRKRLGQDFAFLRRVLVGAGRPLLCARSSLKIQHLVLQLAELTEDKLE